MLSYLEVSVSLTEAPLVLLGLLDGGLTGSKQPLQTLTDPVQVLLDLRHHIVLDGLPQRCIYGCLSRTLLIGCDTSN